MSDEEIIKMYKKGYTIDFIAKQEYKLLNKKSKPIVLDGITLFPAKIYKMNHCRLHVCEVIYKYLIKGDLAHTQKVSYFGRGAI